MRSGPPPKLLASRPSRPPAATTASAITVKGFYLRALLKELADNGHHLTTETSYREFGDYSINVAQELLRECTRRLYPSETRAEALRRIGWIIYPTFLQTMVGKVVFASVGNDVREVLRVAGRGFEISISAGRYQAVRIGERDAYITVRDFPLYPDSLLVGVIEGALAHYGHDDARVEPRVLSLTDVDYELSW
jgi:uncharacterized protein (TIGR02265 family)